jgi:FKBP-type peptidyl-prolyl cis-trans isomerase FkpA
MHGDLKTSINLMCLRFFIFLLLVTVSCNTGHEKIENKYRPGRDDMADVNKFIIQKDRERIQSYFERKGLVMKESPTGLWYSIVKEGEGDYLKENDKLVFEYECSLLDGTKCYSSKDMGPNHVTLGRSELPAGLIEGLKLMRPGGEGIFILPPFLAYGLIGDGKKVPPRSTIVYTIRLIR